MTQEILKLALEALETELSIDWTNNDEFNASAEKMYEAIAAIKEALAQPKKEPIAYINVEKRTLEFAKQIFWHTPTVANLDRIPLYTQRTWVGLTEEEVSKIIGQEIGFNSCWGPEEAFAAAIEAKLKEKNT